MEYSFDDLIGLGERSLRFDIALFSNNNLIGLIEYDGEYHDNKNTYMEEASYNQLVEHDILKNEYCIKNNISLLRINNNQIQDIPILVLYFLSQIELSDVIKSNIKSDFNNKMDKLIYINNNKKANIQNELDVINNKIKFYESLRTFPL